MNAVAGSVAGRVDERALKRGVASVRHPLTQALLALTFTTGLVDAVSYLALGRVFTANMTGIVLLGFGIAGSGGLPVVAPIISLAAFLLGAGTGGLLVQRKGERHPALVARARNRSFPARGGSGRRWRDNSPARGRRRIRTYRTDGLCDGRP
jgi:hypothetical protein